MLYGSINWHFILLKKRLSAGCLALSLVLAHLHAAECFVEVFCVFLRK